MGWWEVYARVVGEAAVALVGLVLVWGDWKGESVRVVTGLSSW